MRRWGNSFGQVTAVITAIFASISAAALPRAAANGEIVAYGSGDNMVSQGELSLLSRLASWKSANPPVIFANIHGTKAPLASNTTVDILEYRTSLLIELLIDSIIM